MHTIIDHSVECDHDDTADAVTACESMLLHPSGHRVTCVDFAAYKAYNLYLVDAYPSVAATAAGLDLIDADIVDCSCQR